MNNDQIVHRAERKEASAAVVGLFSLLLMCASCVRPLPAVGLLEFFNVPLCGYFEVWRNWISFGRRLQKRAQMHLLFEWLWTKIRSLWEYKSGLVQKIQITDASNFCMCARSPAEIETGGCRRGWNSSHQQKRFDQTSSVPKKGCC